MAAASGCRTGAGAEGYRSLKGTLLVWGSERMKVRALSFLTFPIVGSSRHGQHCKGRRVSRRSSAQSHVDFIGDDFAQLVNFKEMLHF